MSFLAEHFTVCPLKELVQRMKDDDLPENAIAVTFDDGYRDNYLNAFPILKRLLRAGHYFSRYGSDRIRKTAMA